MPTSNTACFQAFLDVLARKFARQDILLVLDSAPNHRSGDLAVPNNITLLYLPPYSPELNPKENLWDEIRDRGMASTDNLAWLRNTGRRYIIGAPKSELKKFNSALAAADGWRTVHEGVRARGPSPPRRAVCRHPSAIAARSRLRSPAH
jgi:hypothetical protein